MLGAQALGLGFVDDQCYWSFVAIIGLTSVMLGTMKGNVIDHWVG